ncbi:MAG: hypothetical protein ACRD2C_10340 [Acidimicrobiales bacterium]
MLGEPKTAAVVVGGQPADVLAELSGRVYERLHPVPVGDLDDAAPRVGQVSAGDPPGAGWPSVGGAAPNGDGREVGWVSAADLLVDPGRLDPLIHRGAVRFRSDDRALVVAQVARETVSALTTVAVDLWVRQRRLLDLTAANVVLRAGEDAFVVGVRRAALAVLADDALVGHPDVEIVDESVMFARLLSRSIGDPVPAGAAPLGRPRSVAAVAAVIAAVRRVVRCGDRHLWGTAALAASNAASQPSRAHAQRADADLAALLTARPDLARTIELVTVPADDGHAADADAGAAHADCAVDGCGSHDADGEGGYDAGRPPGSGACAGGAGEITFALRRTCCLLLKLPDGLQCGTCSLRDRDRQVDRMTDWHRQERRRIRSSAG